MKGGIADMMKQHPHINLSIEGHTDSDGSTAYNQSLSEARALSVKNALVQLSVDGRRLTAIGYGESAPMTSNNSQSGKAKNRSRSISLKCTPL